jgi:hypothetical protein
MRESFRVSGDRENSLRIIQWLENLYETHEIASIRLKLNPAFDPLRSDARFAGLLHRMGLPQ